MTSPNSALDRATLVQRYHQQVYRLALLAAGSPAGAAQLTLATFATPLSAPDPELALARRLAQPLGRKARGRWNWQADAAALERSGLNSEQAQALLRLLATRSPAERLLLGLRQLWDLQPHEAAAVVERDPAALLALEVDAALALGEVAPASDRAQLLEIAQLLAGELQGEAALRVRGLLLADAQARELRDGLLRAQERLRQAIPALFAAAPPPALLERLGKLERRASRRAVGGSLAARPRLTLVGIVLLVIALLLAAPLVRQRFAALAEGNSSAAPDEPQALVEAAIHRLDQPLLNEGLLHEVYRAELPGRAWTLERWYDYASPNRLRVEVRDEGDTTARYALATDGRSRVQYRLGQRMGNGTQPLNLDIALPPAEMRAALPILRQQPDATLFNYVDSEALDLSRFYLAQARAATLSDLGATEYAGRAAQIVAYRTAQPWPATRRDSSRDEPSQVLLTLDRASATLLDVTVLAEGQGSAAARHPWRAELFELPATAEDALFSLPPAGGQQLGALPNPRSPTLPDAALLALPDAVARAAQPLYTPQLLPEEQMRSLALGLEGTRTALLYEGEFSTLAVLPVQASEAPGEQEAGPERRVGSYSYRIRSEGIDARLPVSAAYVALPGAEGGVQLLLLDQFATSEERTAQLERLIASLQPITEANVDALSRSFYRPSAAGGTVQVQE